MSQGDDAEKPGSPKMPPPAVPRAKPSVPGAKPPPPPVAKPPALNPFLPPESQGKLSASKIDAGWGDATELEPASSDWVDSEAVIPAASAKMPAAAPPPRPPPPPRSAPQVAPAKIEPIAEPVEPAKPPTTRDSEVPSEPFKKKSRGKVVALLVLALATLGGGGYAYQQQEAARLAKLQVPPPPPTQTVAEPVLTAEPPPPPTHMPDPPPPSASVAAKPLGGAAPAVSIDPAKRAYLDASQVPPGRKIIVDGAVYGTTPRKVAVRCGVHRIQIGDLDPESIDFPCGGEVNFTE